MLKDFEIFQVSDDAADALEAMGTKPKFWYTDEKLGRCLYKQARAETGEDWAEKAAAEIAGSLRLPHARVELARWRNIRGTITPSFVKEGCALIHGNEILHKTDPGYPSPGESSQQFYRVSEHTLDAVLAAVGEERIQLPLDWTPPPDVKCPGDVFLGYLMLDCLIGNQDRHHGNWGFVASPDGILHLAPTFDHASSLGRNESDKDRSDRLATKDRGRSMEAYVERARSAVYTGAGDRKPLTTMDAFRGAAERAPRSALAWFKRLEALETPEIERVFSQMPRALISQIAATFACRMVEISKRRLLDLKAVLR